MSTPSSYHRGRHGLAVLLACGTFLLVVAGATVDSMGAGLSVPDWPTSFGSFRLPPMQGGVLYEHGHRMIAGVVVILTLLLAAWVWSSDRRRWLRMLLLAAIGTVVVQALLGGMTVLWHLPPWIVTAHATVAQSFFCLTVLAAVGTSRAWVAGDGKIAPDAGRPSLRTLTALAASAVLLQLILGAAFRNSAIGLLPHVLTAGVVCLLLLWMVVRILTRFAAVISLRRLAVTVMALLVVQVVLGLSSYITRYSGDASNWPRGLMVAVTVAHVATGSLILVATVLLAVLARRERSEVRVTAAQPRTL